MQSLGTETSRPSSAAQCVAYVAVAELPANQWNYLIGTLVNKVVEEPSSEMAREAALEAIGKCCCLFSHLTVLICFWKFRLYLSGYKC